MAISCADTKNPGRAERYHQIAERRDRAVAPYFGSPWAYKALNCAEWKGRSTERYTGPWDADTTRPILVIGMLHDPGTPYRNAVAVSHLLENSSLLTVDGVGHGAFFGNDCVTRYTTQYLLTGATPQDGAVCHQEPAPFAPPRPAKIERRIGSGEGPPFGWGMSGDAQSPHRQPRS
jgi:hypothetical protein